MTDVETTFRQCCVNVLATLVPNIGDQHWDDMQAMLCQHCGNVGPNIGDWHRDNVPAMLWQCCSQCGWPTFRQHSGNIVRTLWQCCSSTLVTDIETMFRQHCVAMLVSNIVPIFYLGPNWQSHENLNFRHTCNISKYLYSRTFTSTKISNSTHDIIWIDGKMMPFPRDYHSKSTQLCLNASYLSKKLILAVVSNACFSFSKSLNQVF